MKPLVATLLLALCLVSTASADLVAAKGDTRAQAAIVAVKRVLPVCFIPQLETIRVTSYDTEAAAHKAFPGADPMPDPSYSWVGEVEFSTQRIGLIGRQTPSYDAVILCHEVCHILRRGLLTNAQWEAWERVWRDDREHGCLCTDYAATGAEEGLCDSFSSYYCHVNKLSPAATAYFAQLERDTTVLYAHARDRQ